MHTRRLDFSRTTDRRAGSGALHCKYSPPNASTQLTSVPGKEQFRSGESSDGRATGTGQRWSKQRICVNQLGLTHMADQVHSVTLDEAIEAMRLTAQDMSVKYKETSLSVSLRF